MSVPARSVASEPWRDPATQPFVRIEGVTRAFGKVYACDDVSLDIYRGEFFALLGGSGSGKSTLLRILAGLEAPDQGRILIDGLDVTHLPPYQRPVNMMFQSYALFPHMTVEQNIAFGLRQDRLPAGEIRDRVQAMLELVRMPQLGKRKPHQLSGGQRQRVAIAMALACRPRLLIADEPTTALDVTIQAEILELLLSLVEDDGMSLVFITHDLAVLSQIATHGIVLEHGRVVEDAPVAQLLSAPASPVTEGLLRDATATLWRPGGGA
jgi:putrescine transport system ATP-binding protein